LAREKLNPSNVFAALVGATAVFLGLTDKVVLDIAPDSILLKIVVLGGSWLFFGAAIYYYFVLGGGDEPVQPYWRSKHDRLRDDLEGGGGFELTYANWLGRALDGLDGFMGDRDADPGSKLARDMGVATRGPTWTAAAYDRCLLLALIYPLLSMLLVWVWSGHVGVAERAIGLTKSKRSPGFAGVAVEV